MAKTTGLPGFYQGTPEGHGTSRRGAPPSGAGGVLSGPIPYTVGSALSTPWAAGPPGVLGSEAPAILGLYDRRPWESVPGARNLSWYRQASRPVLGESLSVRITREQPRMYGVPPYNTLSGAWQDPWSVAVLSLLVAGWEEGDLEVTPPTGTLPSDPLAAASGTWTPARAAIIGPNLMPDLMWRGRTEIDAGAWAGGARFVGLWLWAYWVGKARPITPIQTWATVLDRPRFEVAESGPAIVTVPRWTILDGPLPTPVTEPYAVWRAGPFPGMGSRSSQRWAVVNGGSVSVDMETTWHLGPMPNHNNRNARFERPTVTAGQAWVSQLSTDFTVGNSGIGVYAANTAASGFAGGPILLTFSGPG